MSAIENELKVGAADGPWYCVTNPCAPPEGAGWLDQVVPVDVKTLPTVLGAMRLTAAVPLPTNTLPATKDALFVPPFATGRVPVTWEVRLTPDSVPPSVKLPDEVTVPVRVMPLTVPVPPTEVTVPPVPVAAIVWLGHDPVMVTPVP